MGRQSQIEQLLARRCVEIMLRGQVRKKARGEATDLRKKIGRLAKALGMDEEELEVFFMNNSYLVPGGAGEILRREGIVDDKSLA